MKKTIKISITLVISVFFILMILHQVNWLLFLQQITKMNITFLILAVCVYFFGYVMRAVRTRVLLLNNKMKIIDLLGVSLLHNLYNRIIPARLGDLSFIYFSKKYLNQSLENSVHIFLFMKFYDLLMIFFFFSIAGIKLYGINKYSAAISLLTAILFIIVFRCSFFIEKVCRIASKFPSAVKINAYLNSLKQTCASFETAKISLKLLLTSFLIWFSLLVLFFLLLSAINKQYGFWETSYASTLVYFSWVLPVNGIGGFGTMELSWAYGFSTLGYDFNEALGSALFMNIIIFICTLIFALPAYIYLLRKEGKSIEAHCTDSMLE